MCQLWHGFTQVTTYAKACHYLGRKDAPSTVKDPKIIKKSTRTEKKTVLKPIVVGSFLNVIKLDEKRLPELSTNILPYELWY